MIKSEIQVILRSCQRKLSPDRQAACTFLGNVWSRIRAKHSRVASAEVTVVFLNDSQMRRYNRQFRSKDYSTDVLSFPCDKIVDGVHYLGDILISVARAEEQAGDKGHSFQQELHFLMLHGLLHLIGYDHETDRGQMRRLETRLWKTCKAGIFPGNR